MTPAPAFTVVIPAYNGERTLASAVRSVLHQTRDDFEIVIVNDGSTDATADVARRFVGQRVRLIEHENRGLPAARNSGIASARGSLVSFLDADDMWLPTYLARMGRVLEERPDAALAYCDAWVFEDATGRIRRQSFFERRHPRRPVPSDPAAFFLMHLLDNFFYVGTTVRRAVLSEVGGFREEMRSYEDYELWLRIEACGYPVVEVNEKLAMYRSSDGQMTRDTARSLRGLLQVLDVLELRRDLPPAAANVLDARRARAKRDLEALARPSSVAGVRRRLRASAGRAWRRVPGRSAWLTDTPPEIRATFPDLRAC